MKPRVALYNRWPKPGAYENGSREMCVLLATYSWCAEVESMKGLALRSWTLGREVWA
jgi:hypothetical protein